MPSDKPALRLHEELLLMALRDEKGTMEWHTEMADYALAGALLAELALLGRVDIGEDKKQRVTALGSGPADDPLLDEALAMIRQSKKTCSATDWVARMTRIKRLRARTGAGLARKGVVRESEDTVLIFFKRRLYPTIDPTPERRIRERLRRAITGMTIRPQPRTALLLALAKAAGMLPIYFEKQLLKQHRARLDSIEKASNIGGATKRAVEAAQAATAAAIIAATAASTAATT